ncbi:hypothetical protein FIBSPDRAFT_218566 [Athelia psychrophila]|uniref:Uncharacterized protein n=1 Tax=Athelia psychrophila TaxID=1759441 RepID=A0A165Z9A4_9AGAM|nr:hypothetical protein FIBSPDRAFT_218566 [Fibularhizoctonia sp. CBS 109695]
MPKHKLYSTSTTCKKHAHNAAGPRLARRETRTRIAPDRLDPLRLPYALPAPIPRVARSRS